MFILDLKYTYCLDFKDFFFSYEKGKVHLHIQVLASVCSFPIVGLWLSFHC